MCELLVLVGISGCGKSYQAKRLNKSLYSDEGVIISSDKIREELYENESIQDDPNRVFSIVHMLAERNISEGKNVIIDATNLRWKFRKALLEAVKSPCKKTAVVVAVSLERCLRQNDQRDRKVPEQVIRNQLAGFCFPCYWEGFDEIYIARPFEWDENTYPITKMLNFDQQNHHHSKNLADHCRAAADYLYVKYGEQGALYTAAIIHDYGKLYTKTFKNFDGSDSEEAHYFGHHSVGAYNLMLCGEEFPVEVYQLITYHMEPYFWKEEKTIQKYKGIFKEPFFSKIMKLHEADEAAH